jgi:TadE-like protein
MRLAPRRAQAGQATVELALCLPLIALMAAALVETASLAVDHVRLWHAARETARIAVVDGDPQHVREALGRTGMSAAELEVEPGPEARIRGEPLTVRLSYRPTSDVPLLGGLLDEVTIRASSTMRIERP